MGDFAIKHMVYLMVRFKYRMFLLKLLKKTLLFHVPETYP